MYPTLKLLLFQTSLISAAPVNIGWPASSNYPSLTDFYDGSVTNAETCTGFVCEKSGLRPVAMNSLVSKENDNRARYAMKHSISNMYKVSWSNLYGEYAKSKAQQCLPPTVDKNQQNYYIYDSGILSQLYGKDNEIVLNEPIALEVMIGRRELAVTKDPGPGIMFEARANEVYMDMFSIERTNATLRGSTTQMGCGYVFTNNETHLIDYMVCLYGLVYLEPKQFQFRTGTFCSECGFYDDKPPDPRQENVTEEMWMCDLKIPVLCTDLKRRDEMVYDASYRCDSPSLGLPEYPSVARLDRGKVDDDQPFRRKEKPPTVPPYPCYAIFFPLAILILISSAFLVYLVIHIVTFPQKRFQEAIK